MKEVGRELFWQWIVSKLKDLFGEDLNYNRAVDIPEAIEFVPHELRTLNILVIDKMSSILEPEQKAKYKELGHYDAKVEGMIEDITKNTANHCHDGDGNLGGGINAVSEFFSPLYGCLAVTVRIYNQASIFSSLLSTVIATSSECIIAINLMIPS
jgi:hypothetical protein